MTTQSLTQTVQACFGLKDLPSLETCHTVIGSLRYSLAHILARKTQREIWGGVFCLKPEDFVRDCDRHHCDFGLAECSFLGKDWRMDLLPAQGIFFLWRQDAAMERCQGYAIVPEMKRRFGFFYKSQALDSGSSNHLKVLEANYEWVMFRQDGSPRFWTFEPKDLSKDHLEVTLP